MYTPSSFGQLLLAVGHHVKVAETKADRPYAVIDVDGVVADVRHRLKHLQRRPKDWAAFFAAADADGLLVEGAAVVSRLASDHEIIYLTGRPERLRRVTIGWLRRHDLPDGDLIMRRAGDRRPARLVKIELLRLLSARQRIGMLVDDDPEVCAAAEAAGFPVFKADWMPPSETLGAAQERDGET